MKIDKRLFILLTMAFIVAAIVGTLSHECGHYLVAKSLGYEARINYMSTSWKNTKDTEFIHKTFVKYQSEIRANQDFPEKARLVQDFETQKRDYFWSTLGGPLETMLTGTIGLLLLYVFRNSFAKATKLSFRQWLLIFIALFWLRQPTNFVISSAIYFIKGKFPQNCDEIKLAHYLQLPALTIEALTAMIGAAVLSVVIFKFIPKTQRLTFIASGLVGGIAGYIFWLHLLGKILLP